MVGVIRFHRAFPVEDRLLLPGATLHVEIAVARAAGGRDRVDVEQFAVTAGERRAAGQGVQVGAGEMILRGNPGLDLG